MAVVCTVAISCCPRVLRTISSPLDNGAYRNCRVLPSPRCGSIVPVIDFSGLASSICVLANAIASAAIDLKKSPHTSSYAQMHGGFRGLFPAKINRERTAEEQGKQGRRASPNKGESKNSRSGKREIKPISLGNWSAFSISSPTCRTGVSEDSYPLFTGTTPRTGGLYPTSQWQKDDDIL
jgi:hypothetical protein